MATLRKSSMADLCYNIQQKYRDSLAGFDAFDMLLQNNAIEFGQDESSSSFAFVEPTTSLNTPKQSPTIEVGASVGSAGSPITISSSSSDDEDAEDSDEDSDTFDTSDSDSDSDVNFMVPGCGTVAPEQFLPSEETVDASAFTHEDAPYMPHLATSREGSPLYPAFIVDVPPILGPDDFFSPFSSLVLPHGIFNPGSTAEVEVAPFDPLATMDFSAPTSTASDDHAEVKCAPPPPLRPPKSRKTIIVSDDEDEDEYKESDTEDDDDDDDDYAPSLGVASKSRKRGRAPHRRSTGKGKKKAVYSSAASSRAPSSRLSPAAEPPFKRRRLVPESRNLQFISPELQRALANTSSENCNFTCPVCGWKQVNKRMPDFHRHLKTHARPDPNDKTEGYWCKGARVENLTSFNAKQRAENDKTIPLDAKPYLFHDHMRVGGCCQQFSRRDALKRHMMNANVTCAGPIGKGLDE